MKKFRTGITYRNPQHWLRTEVRYGVNMRVIRVQNKKNCRNLHFKGLAIFFAEGCFPWSFEDFYKALRIFRIQMLWIFIKCNFLPFLIGKNLCLYLDRDLAKKLGPDFKSEY
jgi:hypothetical protein